MFVKNGPEKSGTLRLTVLGYSRGAHKGWSNSEVSNL